MDKIEVYYFSGTGNSLHGSQGLAKRLPNVSLLPIASLLKKDKVSALGAVVGFIFPVHLSTIPIFLKDFIKKVDLSSAEYIFAVATRIGTEHSAFFEIEKILRKKGKHLSSSFNLNMPSNDPKFNFTPAGGYEMKELEKEVERQLEVISRAIDNKEQLPIKDKNYLTRIPFVRLLSPLVTLLDGIQQNFYADDKCAGCGICKKVCLSGKIKMSEGRPIWQKEIKCFKCYACLNYCPNQAVQIKNFTEKKGRYSHPYASADEIARQKFDM